MVEKLKVFMSSIAHLDLTLTIKRKSNAHHLGASSEPEQNNGTSVIKRQRHKNMRAHILIPDLHSCCFDKVDLINEYE